MIDVYLGLGSNLNGPKAQLISAIDKLRDLKNTSLIKVSSFYQTEPVGYAEQPDFINAVVYLQTCLSVEELFTLTKNIELQQGRVRLVERNGPRTLDIDILLYGQAILNDENLIIPHPRMKTRLFVLHPLYEINPNLILPTGESLSDLVVAVKDYYDDIRMRPLCEPV